MTKMHVSVINVYLKVVATMHYRIGRLQDGSAFYSGRDESAHLARTGRTSISD
jgi:hypothetical protein